MFSKLSFSQNILRLMAGSAMEKQALLGRLAVGAVKRVGTAVATDPLNAGVKGLSIYGTALAGKAGLSRRGAYSVGFDPAVQAWQSRPIGEAL